MLSLKQKEPEAINYFYQALNDLIPEDVAICTVPSSNPENIETGITILAEKLSADKNRIDRTHFLKRTKEIPKLASGGDRRISIHHETIKASEEVSVKGMTVLLLDDVTTTGNSLIACRDILLKNGADDVIMFALGKTKEPEIPKIYIFLGLLGDTLRLIIWITENVIVWLINYFWKIPLYLVAAITILYFITNIL